jgi:type IV pilus assembly protein PilB
MEGRSLPVSRADARPAGGRMRSSARPALTRRLLLPKIGVSAGRHPMTTSPLPSGRRLLGEILLQAGVLSAENLDDALKYQKETGLRLGECLLRLGHCRDEDVQRALARQAGVPFVDVARGRIAPEVIATVPRAVAEEHSVLPVKIEGPGRIVLAVTDPLAIYQLDHLRFLLGLEFRCALTTEAAMREALQRYHGIAKREAATVGDLGRKLGPAPDEGEAPIIRLVQATIEDAVRSRASDIHVEPMADRVRVRFRLDGVCRVVADHPKAIQGAVLSRLKLMAGMDIAEKRKPQDGRIEARVGDRAIDIRVSALPATHGESLVLRLLDKQTGLVSLERLGFEGEDQARFQRLIKRPNGIILVTGPTGSGKTTTLYAALQELNKPNVKIITAENPVEYLLPGINQCQVHHHIGLDFARILRAMLRQAPNIILVGEIRDAETATIAIQAALTGHLVFSTLHTNDAPSALTRLVDMGVAPFLVSSAIAGILAQRLIRRLCARCKQPATPSAEALDAVGLEPARLAGRTVYRAVGCEDCRQTGYRGRLAVYELLEMTPDVREAVFRGAPAADVRTLAVASAGMRTLRDDGHRKILAGSTSVDEIVRVLAKESVKVG